MSEKICMKCGLLFPRIYTYCPKDKTKLRERTWGKLIKAQNEKKRPFKKVRAFEK